MIPKVMAIATNVMTGGFYGIANILFLWGDLRRCDEEKPLFGEEKIGSDDDFFVVCARYGCMVLYDTFFLCEKRIIQ